MKKQAFIEQKNVVPLLMQCGLLLPFIKQFIDIFMG
jgi:hypothetical protein